MMNADEVLEQEKEEWRDRCASLRSDELIVLESLYPDQISIDDRSERSRCMVSSGRSESEPSSGWCGTNITIDLPIALPVETEFVLQPTSAAVGTSASARKTTLRTSTLPSIRFRFHLPDTYPVRSPLAILSIHALSSSGVGEEEEEKEIPSYLPESVHSGMRRKIQSLWAETGGMEDELGAEGGGQGEGVLWPFLDWVATGEFLHDDGFGGLGRETGVVADGSGVGPAYVLPLPKRYTPSTLSALIRQSTETAHGKVFGETTFSCGICLENRKGRGCVRMWEWEGCGDVFCLDCLRECWTLAITEGSIQNVACPSFECTKARVKALAAPAPRPPEPDAIATSDPTNRTNVDPVDSVERMIVEMELDEGRVIGDGGKERGATADLVERVVGTELCERWAWLVEKKRVENDVTYVRCPMAHCQAPVPAPVRPATTRARKSNNVFHLSASVPTRYTNGRPQTETEVDLEKERIRKAEEERIRKEERSKQQEEDRFDRFRECSRCEFSFCRYCDQTWHGIHLPCPMPATQAFLHAYLSLPAHSPEKFVMERRYGVKQLAKMVADWKEQEGNRKWLEENSSACPGCSCRVEKSHGCNHMTCSKCNAHFCYRCSTALRPSDPYAHYRTPGPCFERLFDIEDIRRFEREMAGDNAVGWEVFGNI